MLRQQVRPRQLRITPAPERMHHRLTVVGPVIPLRLARQLLVPDDLFMAVQRPDQSERLGTRLRISLFGELEVASGMRPAQGMGQRVMFLREGV